MREEIVREINEIITRFENTINQLEQIPWYKRWWKRPEQLVTEYYQLDRQISQLMDHQSLTPEQLNRVRPTWYKGYNGLYKKFPERPK